SANLNGLFDCMRHRLFAIHMLAGVHGVDRDFGVPMIRWGDEDRINIFALEQLPIIQIALALADALGTINAALVNVDDSDDLDIFGFRLLYEAPNVPGAHATNTNDSNANAIVCAHSTGRR